MSESKLSSKMVCNIAEFQYLDKLIIAICQRNRLAGSLQENVDIWLSLSDLKNCTSVRDTIKCCEWLVFEDGMEIKPIDWIKKPESSEEAVEYLVYVVAKRRMAIIEHCYKLMGINIGEYDYGFDLKSDFEIKNVPSVLDAIAEIYGS